MSDYAEFLRSKSQLASMSGFQPLWMPDFLFDFQRALVEWAIRKGRAAVFADCGLGKTPMQLVWAENVVRKTNKPVLIMTPLAVAAQTKREADKFGVESEVSRNGKFSAKIVITNYDQLHHFDRQDFAGAVCDESGCIKNFDAVRTGEIREFMRELPYRLLCTATAAPNDYVELGNSAECLGEMGFADMATRFFKKQVSKDHLGWGRNTYQMRPHAEKDFWRWVCSWARACRKPSDLGFDDGKFELPEIVVEEHVIEAKTKRPGFMFDIPAITLLEQKEERRRTLPERCEKAAELATTDDPAVVWCFLNSEGDMLERLIPGAVQVSGSDSDESKEERFLAFASGEIRCLVTKPVIAAWGLNWQHCAHEVFFPSHSFEQYYQAVRRCWRFGQIRKVKADIVASEGERPIIANWSRKAEAAEKMFSNMVELMADGMNIRRSNPFVASANVPAWL